MKDKKEEIGKIKKEEKSIEGSAEDDEEAEKRKLAASPINRKAKD